MPFTILIVDDSKAIVHYLVDILNRREHNLLYTYSAEEAKKIITQNEIDILICDLMLPTREDGLSLIRFFKQNQPESKVLGISAHTQIDNVVDIIRSGADDFIPKTANKEQIIKKINKLKELLKPILQETSSFPEGEEDAIIGRSKPIKNILNQIKIIAENEVETVLIEGESGTGKELVAKTIHRLSPRSKKPFLAINCAGMPDTLIDSELFGFEKGSFTGAYQTSLGKFELANEGILFLDEISEMPLHLQAKLLRVLENREILRIGGKKPIWINVMILAATNQNLWERIQEKKFREDIFFRLNMVKIELPPLRKRKEDIPLLVDYFSRKASEKIGKNVAITESALNLLLKYDFPGNVRELKNIIFNTSLFSLNGQISASDIQQYLQNIAPLNLKKSVPHKNNIDKDTIIKVLRQYNGNITRSAKELGYTREGLSRKIKTLQLNIQEFRESK